MAWVDGRPTGSASGYLHARLAEAASTGVWRGFRGAIRRDPGPVLSLQVVGRCGLRRRFPDQSAEGSPNDTLPGDSGTLWCLEDGLRPIAMQWGAHVFVDAASIARGYALATSLSLICRELDVDILRGHNTGLPPYWGELGHYSIGAKACQLLTDRTVVQSDNLARLMTANLSRIGFNDTRLSAADFQTTGFLPLADVPDIVWKKAGAGDRRPGENPNHFADVDQKLTDGPHQGKTLLQLCQEIRQESILCSGESITTAWVPLRRGPRSGAIPSAAAL